MTIYAYKVVLEVEEETNINSQAYENVLEQHRNMIRQRIRQFGGDPLPDEEIMLSVDRDNKKLIVAWRSTETPPNQRNFIESLKQITGSLQTISGWIMYYHICHNGTRKKGCDPWQELISG